MNPKPPQYFNPFSFDRCVEIILKLEGGYHTDPRDPGGETNYGISKRAHPHLDIAGLTVEQAKSIYKVDYWDAANCDLLFPNKLKLAYFDACVNQGRFNADRFLSGIKNSSEVLGLFLARRALHYSKLDHFPTYGVGWLKRLFIIAEETGKIEYLKN